jgi:hypothetical protein
VFHASVVLVQEPALQEDPLPQTMPHPPQLLASVCKFVQALPQAAKPALHAKLQVLIELQTATEFAGGAAQSDAERHPPPKQLPLRQDCE